MVSQKSAVLLFIPCAMLAFAHSTNNDHDAPNYWGCQDAIAKSFPYCNASLTVEERIQNLISLLTLEEKIQAIAPNLDYDTCSTHTKGAARVGFPGYMWLVETNTAVASACISENKCATEFSGPLTMGASFNRTAWRLKGSVFGTEQRALSNIHGERMHKGSHDYLGLSAYGPNINQQRDPRFGRTSELPGEDPYLSGQYAIHFVQGMQEKDSNGYPKLMAYLKHFTAYSRETGRGHDDYNISLHDLFDTYLPQYEMGLKEGNATGVMCSYNAVNGAPMCSNDFLLNQVMRKKWNLPHAHVTTDCGAPGLLRGEPANAPDNATAAAWSLMNGSDVEMGSTVWTTNLKEAVDRKLATEEAVNQAFYRAYRPHFIVGRFDDFRKSEWSKFGVNDINSAEHQQIQLEAALQGLVLLKHENDVLPIKSGSKVAVLGPLGQTRAGLMSDYENDQSCYGGGHDCVPTLVESITVVNGASTTSASGVDIDSNKTNDIPAALQLASDADVVVLCLGITKAQEREGLDRTDTRLPGLQEDFAHQVFELGKPIILVLVNGGQVALDNLVAEPSAIVEAFNPNTIGGTALALSLFGIENRWGKLPYTIYSYDVMQAFDMLDHSMSAPPGRTHRYFTGKPIYPFGYGLSLTSFEMSCNPSTGEKQFCFQCSVINSGSVVGDEVVQVYHTAGDDVRANAKHPVPLQSLVDFERIRVDAGDVGIVNFEFDSSIFELVNETGERALYPGTHKLFFTNGVLDEPIEFRHVITNEVIEGCNLSAS